MPLPPAGSPISFNDLRNEFGQTSPGDGVSLNEYYRGGPNVPSFVTPGASSFQGPPLASASPVTIPTGGTVQLSMYYQTEATIFGSTGIISAPANGVNYFQDATLPAGVRYLRFMLVGGGGGAGGANIRLGGNGGGGSMMYGTIDTASFGNVANNRILRVFVGKGGQGGPLAGGNSVATPARTTVDHGYPLVPRTFGPWSAWMNTYAVNNDQVIVNGTDSYIGTFSTTRYIYFPASGIYTFQALADNSLTINLNGTNILTTNNSFTFASPVQSSVSVSAGPQRVTFTWSSSGGPGGFACRIVDAFSQEVWNSRWDQFSPPGGTGTPATNSGYPTGGNGGYAGQNGASGYGGAGGSATWFAIIDGASVFPIALAGGGGGGGGGGHVGYAYINGNTRTQHYTRVGTGTSDFRFIAGGEGEFVWYANNGEGYYNPAGTLDPVGASQIIQDGGGGGGGGGGLRNDRVYALGSSYQFRYSGMGGKRSHFVPYGDWDGDAEGGEAGRSWLHPSATTYGDFVFTVTTDRTPNFVTSFPGGAAGMTAFGIGGARSTTQNSAGFGGTHGAAFFDWGYTNPSVGAVGSTSSPLQSSVFPLAITRGSPNYQNMTFLADAWGGGGRPGTSGYTYSWQYHSGNAVSFSAPSSPRTNVSTASLAAPVFDAMGENIIVPAVTTVSGVIRCVVSDGISSHTSFISWRLDWIPPPEVAGGA